MSDMHVLFLALGGSRRREVTDGSATILAGGGTVTVAVDDLGVWPSFDPRVRVVALGPLESRRFALRVERLLLFRAPNWLFRVVGRGPLRRFATRASGAYRQRIAQRLHRRVVLPLYRRLRGDLRAELIRSQLTTGQAVSAVVVTDADSIALLPMLSAAGAARGARVVFRVDEVVVSR